MRHNTTTSMFIINQVCSHSCDIPGTSFIMAAFSCVLNLNSAALQTNHFMTLVAFDKLMGTCHHI